MDRHATQVYAVDEGAAFEVLEIIVGFTFHLSVQYLDAVKAHPGGLFNTGFNGKLQSLFESPE
jgi:hypothetical protein